MTTEGGVKMSDNSIFMRVDEVAKVLDVSESYAYKIIKKLNKELAEKGKIVVYMRRLNNVDFRNKQNFEMVSDNNWWQNIYLSYQNY